MKRRAALGPIALFGLPALAHDMWLVPPESPRPGAAVEVEVSVGMDFPISLTAMAPERLTLTVVGPEGRSAAATLEADEERHRTTATFTPTEPGAWLVAATSMPNRIELEAAKFNDYLLHDGLPHVLAGRMDRGELDRDATERYSKYVKTLLAGGAPRGATAPRSSRWDRRSRSSPSPTLSPPRSVRPTPSGCSSAASRWSGPTCAGTTPATARTSPARRGRTRRGGPSSPSASRAR